MALFLTQPSFPQAKPAGNAAETPPASETLSYDIEWHLIYAGNARLSLARKTGPGKPDWNSHIHVESGGVVSKLYKLDDTYAAKLEGQFCTESTELDALEGKRHHETKVNYDAPRGKATYVERDLLKNIIFKSSEVDIPACTSDIIGGLYRLRAMKLEPGQSAQIPLSDGKRSALARVEAQEREQIQTKLGTFKTIRYEAFVFNGVVYARKARLFVWLTDDARRLPVQIRARMSFPIGSITLQLQKEDHS